eukprot:scaffold236190_cov28-Tisochrysis_lutea.AAC.1
MASSGSHSGLGGGGSSGGRFPILLWMSSQSVVTGALDCECVGSNEEAMSQPRRSASPTHLEMSRRDAHRAASARSAEGCGQRGGKLPGGSRGSARRRHLVSSVPLVAK